MGKKILVVDNDRLMLELMTDLFREQGHEVVTAEDGLTALEILKNYVPDVAFVDLVMPNIRGDKLCRIIRKMPHLKNIHMVIISATAVEELTLFPGLGANAAIAKGPFDEMSKHLLEILHQNVETASKGSTEAPMGFQSINQRKITTELLHAERHLETILNNISEGVLELNPDGKIIYCNSMCFSICGIPEDELLGLDFFALFEGTHRKEIENLLLKIGGGPPEISDKFFVKLQQKWITLKLLPVEHDTGWSIIAIIAPLDAAVKPQ